jgi:hypothetical protein
MSDIDTMRWGDTQNILLATAAALENGFFQSSQMLNAHWQRPCVWRLMLSIQPNMAVGDVLTFQVTVLMRVGVGQANQQVPLATFAFAAPYLPVLQFFDIPAENLQLQFAVGAVSNTPATGDNVTIAAFIAPRAEPGGIVQIRDSLPGNDGIREPDRDGLPRWMPRGYEDGEVRYRGR